MPLDPTRAVAELEELRQLTGDDDGAQRVAWTATWETARSWLRDKVAPTGALESIDAAGNQWFTLAGDADRAVLIGGHMDSVPNGGWLDGCLNVVAGLEVLRRVAEDGQPPVTVRLVSWADEEGARFGRSLFGSSAAAGSLADRDELRQLADRDGIALPDALAAYARLTLWVRESDQRPVKAEALAQANLDGGGNTDAQAVATTPFPLQNDAEPQPELKTRMQQVRELEQQQARLLTQIKSKPSTNLPAPPTQAKLEPGQTPNASDLMARSLEIARLEAQIDRNHNAYQSRPKRKNIGARTEEYRFAQYVESWRLKVERVGNLNYPEEARQKKLYGSLRITVNILADGNLESAEIDRSSGSRILDEAALRIIKMAAPYSPLPENIRKDTDILGITRTLSFTRSDQLASQ